MDQKQIDDIRARHKAANGNATSFYLGFYEIIPDLLADRDRLTARVEALEAEHDGYRKKDKQGQWFDAIECAKISIGLQELDRYRQADAEGCIVSQDHVNAMKQELIDLNAYEDAAPLSKVQEWAKTNTPTPPILETKDGEGVDYEFIHLMCPKCKVILHQHFRRSRESFKYPIMIKHCTDCGQRIDWDNAKIREAADAALKEGTS